MGECPHSSGITEDMEILHETENVANEAINGNTESGSGTHTETVNGETETQGDCSAFQNWGIEDLPNFIRATEYIEEQNKEILCASAFMNLRINDLYIHSNMKLADMLSTNDANNRPVHIRRLGRLTMKLIFNSKETRDRVLINRIKMGDFLVSLELPRAETRAAYTELWLSIYNIPVSESNYGIFEWLKRNNATPLSDIRYIQLGRSGITNTGRNVRIRIPKGMVVPGFCLCVSKQ